MSALVETSDLAVGYGGPAVLTGVTFAAGPGQAIAVLAPNGGGKTTLFRALVGELTPVAGALTLAGRPAYLAQTERTRLDFPVSALDVATMGALARSPWWRPARRSDRRAAADALERVGLAAEAGARFGALSAGQRQRVLLARALVQRARLLILDEPFAGVDAASAERMSAVFDELRDEGRTIIVATHDMVVARRYDRVLCLNRRQIAFGEPERTLSRPVLEATYRGEIVVIDEPDGPVRAVAVQHHEHPHG
jgi:manganese/iron transport system ATP-binding protein/manganese/zinc/iron transport system ATP- binding protein